MSINPSHQIAFKRFRLTIAYDGTNYAGWQVQPNGLAVQQVIEEAIERVGGMRTKLHGSGRTDRGVHAVGQVAHSDLPAHIPAHGWQRALNAILPPDIRIMKLVQAKGDFHARKSAIGKEYRYFVWNSTVMPPYRRLYALHIPDKLDIDAMRAAGQQLTGKHDFAAFTANPNRIVESTVRTVYSLDVRRRGCELILVVKGEGFLYKMVRSLAGYLVKVGLGRLPRDGAEKILLSRQRTALVETAPSHGLFLWRVSY